MTQMIDPLSSTGAIVCSFPSRIFSNIRCLRNLLAFQRGFDVFEQVLQAWSNTLRCKLARQKVRRSMFYKNSLAIIQKGKETNARAHTYIESVVRDRIEMSIQAPILSFLLAFNRYLAFSLTETPLNKCVNGESF